MNSKIDFKALFEGYQKTPLLWTNNDVFEFNQFNPDYTKQPFLKENTSIKLRLGRWVEQFVSFQLRQAQDVQIIKENMQIRNGKQTIGELDLLFLKNNSPIHLEIIYKFYLHDCTKTYSNPLEYWLGPNRNDSLVHKLNKLKNKQLPLLHQDETKMALRALSNFTEPIEQRVCFKAQLFLPYPDQEVNISPLNKECIVGYYASFKTIDRFKEFEFYIPTKLEWLIIPHNDVQWLSYEKALVDISIQIDNEKSPLVWLKNNHQLHKCFITFW